MWLMLLGSASNRSKKDSRNNFDPFAIFAICIVCVIMALGVFYAILKFSVDVSAQPKEPLPQVDVDIKFIAINSSLSYEENTTLVYIKNLHRKGQTTYSIYYNSDGKPMTYQGMDIPFDIETIGEYLVVDVDTGIVYRQEIATSFKNYSAYYGNDGLLRKYSNGILYPIDN